MRGPSHLEEKMPYNSIINRSGAAALIPEDVAAEIRQNMVAKSAVMQLATRLPDLSRAQQRIPVISALPTAYWVNPTDTGLKQTSNVSWDNVYLNIEELAVIVPIPESVLDDSDYDMWAQVRPLVEEAMGAAFDAAVVHGTGAPSSFPDDILTGAAAAGNTVAVGSVGPDIYDDIMGVGGVIAQVEEDGYMVDGHLAAIALRARLRGLRDANGQPIFAASMQEGVTQYSLDGEPLLFARNGALDATAALLVSGEWKQLVYGVRQDITVKILSEAAIFDNTGALVYNLPQQDMLAMRAVLRIGWALPNPASRIQPTAADRYPFAVLTP